MSLPSVDVQSYVESWQRTLPGDLPALFYAYNASSGQTERVVSYVLEGEDLATFVALNPANIKVHMASQLESAASRIQTAPPFVPILQAYQSGQKDLSNSFLMTWDPNPPFLRTTDDSPLNGIDQIPPEGAYLFILAWLELSYQKLEHPFEAIAANLVKRVRSYTFNTEETQKILEMLGPSPLDKQLYIHMGLGISVQKHPFSFRPVLQVHTIGTDPLDGDDGDDGFFDFSNPCPPRCGGGDG